MASPDHADFKNPYHYSFSLCAANKKVTDSFEGNGSRNDGNYFKNQNKGRRMQDSSYSKYLGEVSEYKFYCDRCDRSFRNNEDLKKHLGEHVTCGKNGCKFTAHPKIIATHIKMQHRTGLFQQLKKLDSPEEVKKWIEERKRKYPTAKNIEKKVKLEEAKEKRGETIKPDTGRFNRDFGLKGSRKRNAIRKPTKKARNHKNIAEGYKQKVADFYKQREESSLQNGLIPSFKGLGTRETEETEILNNPDDGLVTDDDDIIQNNKEETIVNKSLALLMSYCSDQSDDEGGNIPNSEAIVVKDNDAPEEIKNVKPQVEEILPETHVRKRKLPEKVKGNPKRIRHNRKISEESQRKRQRKPTLLQKLLHSDIEHEKKVILECVHHVVKNSFFERTHGLPMNRKPTLLGKLLKDEILKERNAILQCIRHIVKANFFDN